MAKLLKLRRGTSTQHTTFTGAEGEVTVNTTNDSLHVHDGTTAGGTELAKADLSNVDGSLSNNLGFADNTKALFGAGNDLQIYHDGFNSYVRDEGTGELRLNSHNSVRIRKHDNETMALFTADGAVELYYDNVEKLATTSSGIDVTGSVTCDGLQCDGTANIAATSGVLRLTDTDSSASANLNYVEGHNSTNGIVWKVGHAKSDTQELVIGNEQASNILFRTDATDRLILNGNGTALYPSSSGTMDLGGSGNQYKDGYFDGSVNCDGLVCDGDLSIRSGYGTLLLRDTSNSGTGAQTRVVFEDSNGNTQSNVGHLANNNNDLYVSNESSANLVFRTGGITRCYVDSSGHFNPGVNNTYDLGTSSVRWRNVYTNDLNLSNEGSTNDVDGTWGSWTIQEGEDDLFLLNRRNGKKYKFNLSEVN